MSTTRYERASSCASSKVLVENSPGETGELDEIIGNMLRPYERPDERSLIRGMPTRREREARERAESQLIRSAESELQRALGLSGVDEPRQPYQGPTCTQPPPR